MSAFPLTPSQTVGPFFHHCLLRADATRNVLTTPETVGQRIRIEGYVYDGDHAPVPDAMIEIWQANSQGRYYEPASRDVDLASRERKRPEDANQTFIGYGRSGTDANGLYWFETIKPGPVRFDRERLQAPHICVAVFARGLLNHLYTRIYFEDEPANTDDPVLQSVPDERRGTLVAQRRTSVNGTLLHGFGITLQGARETVFFQL